MQKNKLIPIYVEYNIYSTTQTLVLDNPAEVIFMNIGGLTDQVVINNNFTLDSIIATNTGSATNPSIFTIKMNPNEIDITDYHVKFTGTPVRPRLNVIVKYYKK
jgi:hypothetical protein